MAGERLQCRWCKSANDEGQPSCSTCGAPLNAAQKISDSGWREAPRLRDLTEIKFGEGSMIQVDGEIVPVADITLNAGDSVFFEHHALLWKDDNVPLHAQSTGGGIRKMLGGMPFVLTVATGPGRIAFSRDGTGELIVLPFGPSDEIDVRGHSFLIGSHTLTYQFERIKGLKNIIHGGEMYLDEFKTNGQPGVLVLHGYGNVFERTLATGESILLEPGAFLYKDGTVTINVEQQDLKTGMFGGHSLWLARMTGPGRVGIQSMYHHHAD
jgi:uncharacterized protein (AIM24 family)